MTSEKQKWHKYPDEVPTEEGEYLCAIKSAYSNVYFEVMTWIKDLYDFDEYDFYEYKGQKANGFIKYDSEYGYYQMTPTAWQKIEWSGMK